nr:hypothetical protein [Sphingomonas sp. Y57]
MTRDRSGAVDAPLFAWGEALRTARAQRRRLLRDIGTGAIGCLVVLSTAAWPPLPRLVWNATDSVPRGLYRIEVAAPVAAATWSPRACRLPAGR